MRNWSSAEILLYQCYYRIAPWGEERGDVRNAMSMAQTANMHRDPSRNPEPFDLYDFMPFGEKPEKEEPKGGEPAGLRQLFQGVARKK